ncbi:DUF2809 domain-containing protein [Flavobacterium magnum]|uniref:DUF2809 domain-containing protein n=1 Tax=Flavobacterium magnum TaxID=2162713 RepID=A0A2S0RE83_9FLAO|nr:DUF2809 domain-containing protein [Flavobacterium magnum]AWA29829.1 DUF2809 domain-containing protein [Flavobacterium magnum]
MALRFDLAYFCGFLLLIATECFIAGFIHDDWIRPYAGDTLVVILLYCFVRAFVKIDPYKAAVGVLLFAYLIEFAQYLQLLQQLGLTHSRVANLILGNSFEWIDLVAYTVGFAAIVVTVRMSRRGGQKV